MPLSIARRGLLLQPDDRRVMLGDLGLDPEFFLDEVAEVVDGVLEVVDVAVEAAFSSAAVRRRRVVARAGVGQDQEVVLGLDPIGQPDLVEQEPEPDLEPDGLEVELDGRFGSQLQAVERRSVEDDLGAERPGEVLADLFERGLLGEREVDRPEQGLLDRDGRPPRGGGLPGPGRAPLPPCPGPGATSAPRRPRRPRPRPPPAPIVPNESWSVPLAASNPATGRRWPQSTEDRRCVPATIVEGASAIATHRGGAHTNSADRNWERICI